MSTKSALPERHCPRKRRAHPAHEWTLETTLPVFGSRGTAHLWCPGRTESETEKSRRES
jgi:hypothetical protein